MDPLFPELPEDLAALSDEDLENLLQEHQAAAKLIAEEDEDFLKGASAEEILEALEVGAQHVEAIRAEQAARIEAQENFEEDKNAKLARFQAPEVKAESPDEEGDGGDEGDGEEGEEEAAEVAEVVAEAEAITEEASVEEPEPVLAAAEPEVKEEPKASPPARSFRRPPAPSAERAIKDSPGTMLVAAAGLQETRAGQPLDRMGYADIVRREAIRRGPVSRSERGIEERILVARAEYQFPEDRILTGELESDMQKIRSVIPQTTGWGDLRGEALTASGGLCAPLTPIYSMPNFASNARPVRDALPSFNADRGGVQVAPASSIGDISTAISSISEANDALGGTFATKSCQDLDCPTFEDVAVQILAHCREYGNLNARAWPEKIAHENDLTMAAHARTAEQFLLDRIKTLSLNVTQAEVLGAYADLVHAVTKAAAGIRFRLRMAPNARFRLLLPGYLPNMLAADSAMTQFTRYDNQAVMIAHLESLGFATTFYMDDVTGGTSQGFSAEVDSTALDDFPDDLQWGIFPEGQFIHVDGGSLELGLVRDSTLNSTNDYQMFGETFENVAMLGPTQGALWVVQGICPSGEFPALGTALSC